MPSLNWGVTSCGAHVSFSYVALATSHMLVFRFMKVKVPYGLMGHFWVTAATLQICLAPAVSQILSNCCMFAWYSFLLSCDFPWLPLCFGWWQWRWLLSVTKMLSRSMKIICRLGDSCTAVDACCSYVFLSVLAFQLKLITFHNVFNF